MLEMSGVSLRRGGRALLQDFSLKLPDPGNYLICGPCASGKTLLGLMMAGRLCPDGGTVSLDGTPLYRSALRGIAALFQGPAEERPMLFHAQPGLTLDPAENLYRYLDTEMWRAGAPASALLPYWEIIERAIPEAKKRSLGSLATSEMCLAQLALGAAVPVRLAVLDGQLDGLDAEYFGYAQRLLALAPQQERFIILTGRPQCSEPGHARRIDLTGGMPSSLAAATQE